jgi:hypothetical protein
MVTSMTGGPLGVDPGVRSTVGTVVLGSVGTGVGAVVGAGFGASVGLPVGRADGGVPPTTPGDAVAPLVIPGVWPASFMAKGRMPRPYEGSADP